MDFDNDAGVAEMVADSERSTVEARLVSALLELDFTRGAAERVTADAFRAAEEAEDRAADGLVRSARVLHSLLREQGIAEPGASILASMLPGVDLSRLTCSSRVACAILDVGNPRLKECRDDGTISPSVLHKVNGWPVTLCYSPAELLYLAAWRALHPRTGGRGVWRPARM